MAVHLLPIRHHGVGSARMVAAALTALAPDAVLIEGPPDAHDVLPMAGDAAMKPPVALLVYNPALPAQAVWYPFAAFSPEWVAIRYALARGIMVEFMDLPQAHMLALTFEMALLDLSAPNAALRLDPLGALAKIAGYDDGERWWDLLVEQGDNGDPMATFAAVADAMSALRAESETEADALPSEAAPGREALREAWMRKTIRAAEKQHERIAVICGAWHVPALTDARRAAKGSAAQDNQMLKKMASVKTTATWAPWTFDRLALAGGYGAGITAPGWYDHLWTTPNGEVASRWLARVASLLRGKDMNASTAQVIDAVRLAETLAALRGRGVPTLDEMNEAARSVFCKGEATPMKLIETDLVVGVCMGAVPPTVPTVPLQRDLEVQQKAVKLKPSLESKDHDFDLREPLDRARSVLLNRLSLLHIHWGRPITPSNNAKGTFHEYWRVMWTPDFAIQVIEAARWGSTVHDAAAAFAIDQAQTTQDLSALVKMVRRILNADLPDAAGAITKRVAERAALTQDITLLMDALPPLIDTASFGDVRGTDQTALSAVAHDMTLRICIGLAPACHSLDDDAAAHMAKRMNTTTSALTTLNDAGLRAHWLDALRELADRDGINGLLGGRAVRLLRDSGALTGDAVIQRMRQALSPGVEPNTGAAWIDGFLSGGGTLLLHDDAMFDAVDRWVRLIPPEIFTSVLPLLRRTFSGFQSSERRAISERVRIGKRQVAEWMIDEERARRVLPLLAVMLGEAE